ncbi:hypothetical protein BAUCODRAFT_121671 [Baudoinia panamericana UAMH 10762]|uniref:Uncharacterized protein n=1 Tax=Baudoinia panamericana (strain UAMH 10762) TaxID=717646 RepID=M2ND84_BAUPA|nr:uncharacterized protein BAUCODRAFT_121671 [Baudoinia panamericana UAMH 10762]EMC97169.1 hypothetical protein BAUCODRAFT_121671 [Baudoinia panamericana UAMH 10762]
MHLRERLHLIPSLGRPSKLSIKQLRAFQYIKSNTTVHLQIPASKHSNRADVHVSHLLRFTWVRDLVLLSYRHGDQTPHFPHGQTRSWMCRPKEWMSQASAFQPAGQSSSLATCLRIHAAICDKEFNVLGAVKRFLLETEGPSCSPAAAQTKNSAV